MEANNAAKMREALVEIDELTNLLDIPEDKKNLLFAPSHSFVAVKMRKIIKKALEEPERNCDVGTAEEQRCRYDEWRNHDELRAAFGKDEFEWAQMPYEVK